MHLFNDYSELLEYNTDKVVFGPAGVVLYDATCTEHAKNLSDCSDVKWRTVTRTKHRDITCTRKDNDISLHRLYFRYWLLI